MSEPRLDIQPALVEEILVRFLSAEAGKFGFSRAVIDKPPSADLFTGQTDEAELGFTYAEVDRLLELMIDQRYTEDELVSAGFAPEFIEKVARRIVQNQYKRVMPVIAKLSERTINQDFRYLRSWGH